MFQKNHPKSTGEEPKRGSRFDRSERNAKSASASKNPDRTNLILADVEIVGTVRFKNDVVIDGRIDGEIHSDGSVTIGEKATVNASIRGRNVIVEGTVHGDIHAADRLELMENAEVTGDVRATILSMQAGAVLIGSSSVGNAARDGASEPGDGKIHEFRRSPDERTLAHA